MKVVTFEGTVSMDGAEVGLTDGVYRWPLHERLAEEWASPIAAAAAHWGAYPSGTLPLAPITDPAAAHATGTLTFDATAITIGATDLAGSLAALDGVYVLVVVEGPES